MPYFLVAAISTCAMFMVLSVSVEALSLPTPLFLLVFFLSLSL